MGRFESHAKERENQICRKPSSSQQVPEVNNYFKIIWIISLIMLSILVVDVVEEVRLEEEPEQEKLSINLTPARWVNHRNRNLK